MFITYQQDHGDKHICLWSSQREGQDDLGLNMQGQSDDEVSSHESHRKVKKRKGAATASTDAFDGDNEEELSTPGGEDSAMDNLPLAKWARPYVNSERDAP
ncbi:hypothetical protein V866_001974 [Kwoniella sp. B9012]